MQEAGDGVWTGEEFWCTTAKQNVKKKKKRGGGGRGCDCLLRETGVKGPTALESGSVSPISLHRGIQSCLMPFEQKQTFKRVSVPD